MSKCLTAFEGLFRDAVYRHRDHSQGDMIAALMGEDLYDYCVQTNPAHVLPQRAQALRFALNTAQIVTGRKARRGDGTFGEVAPGTTARQVTGRSIPQGPVADLQIGIETKILSTAIQKQQGRVASDLKDQANVFEDHNPIGLRVAIVGVNHAAAYHGYEGDRVTVAETAPRDEAAGAITHIQTQLQQRTRGGRQMYDEPIFLRFSATNIDPFDFEWVNLNQTQAAYDAALVRLAREYRTRFP